MASFQAKTGWERQRKSEKKKNLSFRSVPTQPITKNSKKNSKKIKKNTIMASFQAKIGWESPRKRENKNYHSNQFLPDHL